MPKQMKYFKFSALVLSLGILASCGGSGSSTTGGQTDFSVVPTDWELAFAEDNLTCSVDSTNRPEITVTIVGGSSPYTIVNSSPQYLETSATVLEGTNPTFTVYSKGGCGDSLNILVLDNLSRSVSFTATMTAGEVVSDDS